MLEARAMRPLHLRGSWMREQISAVGRTRRENPRALQDAETALRAHHPRTASQCDSERRSKSSALVTAARRHRAERRLIWCLVVAACLSLLGFSASGALHDANALVAGVLAVLIALAWILIDISGYRLAPYSDDELSGLAGMLSETWPLDDQESNLVYQICSRHPDLAATRASWAAVNPRLTVRELRLLTTVANLRAAVAVPSLFSIVIGWGRDGHQPLERVRPLDLHCSLSLPLHSPNA